MCDQHQDREPCGFVCSSGVLFKALLILSEPRALTLFASASPVVHTLHIVTPPSDSFAYTPFPPASMPVADNVTCFHVLEPRPTVRVPA